MGYDPLSVIDVHKKYGGSGSLADRGQTWFDLGLGALGSYSGTGAQNKQLREAIAANGGLTLATPASAPAPTPTPAPAATTPAATPAVGTETAAPASAPAATPVAAAPVYNDPELEAAIAQLRETKYAPSDEVAELKKSVDNAVAAVKNQNYQFAQQLETQLQKILNPETFRYDFATDPNYIAMRDEYIRNGKLAMLDTGAAAAAANGGRETSYGRAAAQQAYQGYMSELNSKIPQLENNAYERYRDDIADAFNRYQLLVEDRQRERDELIDDRDFALELYRTARDEELEEYGLKRDELLDIINALGDREQTAYSRGRDKITDERYEREYGDERADTAYQKLATLISSAGYTPTDAELEKAGMSKGQADALKAAYEVDAANAKKSSSSSGSGTKKSSSSFKEATADSKRVSLMNKYGTDTDEDCIKVAKEMHELYKSYGSDWADYAENNKIGDKTIYEWLAIADNNDTQEKTDSSGKTSSSDGKKNTGNKIGNRGNLAW